MAYDAEICCFSNVYMERVLWCISNLPAIKFPIIIFCQKFCQKGYF